MTSDKNKARIVQNLIDEAEENIKKVNDSAHQDKPALSPNAWAAVLTVIGARRFDIDEGIALVEELNVTSTPRDELIGTIREALTNLRLESRYEEEVANKALVALDRLAAQKHELWCPTCGKPSIDGKDCATCAVYGAKEYPDKLEPVVKQSLITPERARELAYIFEDERSKHLSKVDNLYINYSEEQAYIGKVSALILAELQAERERAIEECKDDVMRGSFLSNDSPEYKWAKAVCRRLDALKEAKNADAE
jgi:rubrerythrin